MLREQRILPYGIALSHHYSNHDSQERARRTATMDTIVSVAQQRKRIVMHRRNDGVFKRSPCNTTVMTIGSVLVWFEAMPKPHENTYSSPG